MRCRHLALRHLSPGLLVALVAVSCPLWAQSTMPPDAPSFQLLHPSIQLTQASASKSRVRFRLENTGYVPIISADKAGLTGSLGKPKPFAPGISHAVHALSPSYGKTPGRTIPRTDALAHYGQHIPWAGPLILRIRQHTKDHPQFTRVLKFLVPAN